jgi:hypothetical protein
VAAALAILLTPFHDLPRPAKSSNTGLLKVFLDQFRPNGLADIIAFPLMLGAAPEHSMAPELLSKREHTEVMNDSVSHRDITSNE